MQFAHLATSFLAISQLLFTGMYFLVHHGKIAGGRLYALFCLCIIAYLADNLTQLDSLPALNHAASFFAILGPGIFWLICRKFFEDESQIPSWSVGIIGFYLILRFIGVLAENTNFEPYLWQLILFFVLPNIIMLALICHTMFMAVRGRNDDLIEARRNTRLLFSVFIAMLLLGVITLETLLLPNTHFDNILYFVIFLINLLLNLRLFEVKYIQSVLTNTQGPELPASKNKTGFPDAQDKKLVTQVQTIMEKERRYSTMGLTIPALASELQSSEHRLRRVINYQLHFRNFNQFLNHYRIAEAGIRLKSSAESHIPILTIAMDVGYRSLSAFNKAFMERYQMTPTQYRRHPANTDQ